MASKLMVKASVRRYQSDFILKGWATDVQHQHVLVF